MRKILGQHKTRKNNQNGFSLMEVLVAMAVFSTAGLALMATISQTARNANQAEMRALATIVAENHLADILSQRSIFARSEKTQIDQLGKKFWIELTVAPTEINKLFEVDVVVRAEEKGRILAERSTFCSSAEFL